MVYHRAPAPFDVPEKSLPIVQAEIGMPKPRSKIVDYLAFLAVRLVVCIVQALPPDAEYTFAQGLARLAYQLDRRHRDVARTNLAASFGQLSEACIERLVRDVFLHFCSVVLEMIQLPRKLHINNWRRHLDISEARTLVGAMTSGRPLMIVTGHFGNWEMAGYCIGLLGFTCHAVARPIDNPYLDDFLRRFRESTGQKLLAKKGDFDQMQRILGRGGILATLADQDAGRRGLFVEFFGRPASTHKAIALLCLEHKVPLAVIGVRKLAGRLKYRAMCQDLIYPEEYDAEPDALRAITQRFTRALERIVCTAPEQYFWLHRRWKHQPALPRRKAA
jgi:KDO2-lipid IV(A) lauroyltransferase